MLRFAIWEEKVFAMLFRMSGSITAVLLFLVFCGGALAASIHTPERGSAERKAILDSLRPAMETSMRGPVEFVVNTMNVMDGWAFISVTPQLPGGGQIDLTQTGFAKDIGFMDGLQTFALSRFYQGHWHHVEHHVGPTDVSYEYWIQLYGVSPKLLGFK